MSAIAVAVTLVALERLGELALAQRNMRALKRRGAVEFGRSHYGLIVALHAAWLTALMVTVPAATRPNWLMLGLYVGLQFGRGWAILSLGPYWTTRVVTVPGEPLVRRGPYRFLRHPIYVVVVAEIAVLPLAFGAWRLAVGFSIVNLALLCWRIAVEDRALAPRRD